MNLYYWCYLCKYCHCRLDRQSIHKLNKLYPEIAGQAGNDNGIAS